MSAREFATDVATRLQRAGFQALWAGGCVRDQLLGRTPSDYDIATDAKPEQVRELFGHSHTIAIGESFGVITVIGTRQNGNIEIATFRRDSGYSDGRRPDAIAFTDAREDAIRRDFTINGMFYDPVKNELIDFVDGRADIDCRVIRAIGNPAERIAEDKLRMLRAVRFAANLDFELETGTMQAIQAHAAEIGVVSPERIGAEMRRMLVHQNRAIAIELLKECGLLKEILVDGQLLYENRANWRTRLRWLSELGSSATFEQAASILLSKLIKQQGILPTVNRWKLSNAESESIVWIEDNLMTLSRAHQLPWSTIQPLLIRKDARAACQIAAIEFGADHEGVRLCRDRLSWPADQLNPAPLISGAELIAAGISPGAVFTPILTAVRAAQLDGEIDSADCAMAMAMKLANQPPLL